MRMCWREVHQARKRAAPAPGTTADIPVPQYPWPLAKENPEAVSVWQYDMCRKDGHHK